MDAHKATREAPSFAVAVAPLVITAILLMVQFFIFGDFTPHVPLAFGVLVCGLFAVGRGTPWFSIEASMFKVVQIGIPAIFILMCIGMLIGSWIASGTVPTLLYYGFSYLSGGGFLVVTCLLCSLISLMTGTSWGTVGTVGLALMGVGEGLGIPAYLTGGAIVSGAFFGDKMSPLSETTNLAPAVCGTDLWSHIKGMLPTTVPAMLIALSLYAWIGSSYAGNLVHDGGIEAMRAGVEQHYKISLLTLLPPLVVIVLAMRKAPALPVMFAGVVLAAGIAVFYQGIAPKDLINVLQNGFVSQTGVTSVDKLLSKGGIMSMTWVITLTLIALAFVGALEAQGTLDAIRKKLDQVIRGRFLLVLSSHTSVLGVGTLVGDVYTSLVLPGQLLKDKYTAMGYKPTVLSRSIEDCGTLCSPLIPWNMGGAFVSASLGVPTVLYAPVAFACWLSPVFGLIWAATGKFMPRLEVQSDKRSAAIERYAAPASQR
ncbi:Na+/H+ antiporter NhaC [Pseudomonas sp. NCHU5208]|uniref:Na+/H+ antiporter NhaC n=1 Tax=unclassified Pseudomonas TaxID=196821 RepID=UPI003F9DC8C7